MDTIDNRFPFIEVPQTWWAIKNNYDAILFSDNKLLLKKSLKRRVPELRKTNEIVFEKGNLININTGSSYIKIKCELSIIGKLMKLFYNIPAVNMTVLYEDGYSATKRVILENFSSGVDLSSIPLDFVQAADYLNHSGRLSKVKNISFTGTGLKFYKKNFSAEFFEILNGKSQNSISQLNNL